MATSVYEDNGGNLFLAPPHMDGVYDVTLVPEGDGIEDMLAAEIGQHGDGAGWTVDVVDFPTDVNEVARLTDCGELLLHVAVMGRAAQRYFGIPRGWNES